MRFPILPLPAALAVLSLGASGPLPAQAGPSAGVAAEVVVLSTLHRLHPRVPGYGFAEPSGVVEGLRPDVLAVELTAEDLARRTDQRTKREYPESVYPPLERHGYGVVPLEASEPLFSELLRPNREAALAFAEEAPEAARAFAAYQEALYDHLLAARDSPASVNSATTYALFAVEHAFQDAEALLRRP